MIFVFIVFIGFLLPIIGIFAPIVTILLISCLPLFSTVIPSVNMFGFQQSLFGTVSLTGLPIFLIGAIVHVQKYYQKIWLPITFLFLLLLLILLNSYLIHVPLTDGLREGGGILFLAFTIIYSAISVKSIKSLRVVLFVNILLALAISLNATLDFIYFKTYTRVDAYATERTASFLLKNPTDLALYTLFFFAISLAISVNQKSLFAICLSAFFLGVILLTYSLAGIAGVIIIGISLFILARLYKIWWAWLLAVTIGSIVPIIIISGRLYNLPIFERVRSFGSGMDRFKIWDAVLQIYYGRPLLGYTAKQSHQMIYREFGDISSAHNAYLGWLLDYGILGAFLIGCAFLWFTYNLIYFKRSEIKFAQSIRIGCLCFLPALFFFGVTHSFGINKLTLYPFWIISTCLIAIGFRTIKQ